MIYRVGLFVIITVFSFSLSQDYKSKLTNQKKLLEDYIGLLNYIFDYIKFDKKDIITCITEYENTYKPYWSRFCMIGDYSVQNSPELAWELWINKLSTLMGLEKSQQNALFQTSTYIGHSTSDIQLNRLSGNINLVKDELKRVNQKLSDNCKTIQKTIVFTGLTIGLIII